MEFVPTVQQPLHGLYSLIPYSIDSQFLFFVHCIKILGTYNILLYIFDIPNLLM
jgi:hypothetical protein